MAKEAATTDDGKKMETTTLDPTDPNYWDKRMKMMEEGLQALRHDVDSGVSVEGMDELTKRVEALEKAKPVSGGVPAGLEDRIGRLERTAGIHIHVDRD